MNKEQQKIMKNEAKAYEFNYYHAANTPGVNTLVREVKDHWENGFIAGYNSRDEEVQILKNQLAFIKQNSIESRTS